MLFLLNDVVLRLDGVAMDAQLDGKRMLRLSFPAILRMGQELFAREPLLPHTNPERARRLAALISAKAPMINAALFVVSAAVILGGLSFALARKSPAKNAAPAGRS